MATRKTAWRAPRAAARRRRHARERPGRRRRPRPAGRAGSLPGSMRRQAAMIDRRLARPGSQPRSAASEPFAFPLPWLMRRRGESAAGMNPLMPLSPQRVLDLQQDYLKRMGSLWRTFFEHPDQASEPIKDPRFSDPAWQKNSLASLYARAYLVNAEFLNRMADAVEVDRKTKKRVKFAVQQWVDATSPSNFLATNPKAQQTLLESGGESLKAGMENLLGDLQRGKITQTDESGVRRGQERRHQRRRDRLREPAVPADPVQGADDQGARAPVPAGPALHQQVLHPRPAARELVHPLRGGAGAHGVRGVVEEPAASPKRR